LQPWRHNPGSAFFLCSSKKNQEMILPYGVAHQAFTADVLSLSGNSRQMQVRVPSILSSAGAKLAA
jgi:hypothetical protein